jgi:deoxyadenosine/deoxycytidine kinase
MLYIYGYFEYNIFLRDLYGVRYRYTFLNQIYILCNIFLGVLFTTQHDDDFIVKPKHVAMFQNQVMWYQQQLALDFTATNLKIRNYSRG